MLAIKELQIDQHTIWNVICLNIKKMRKYKQYI